MTWQLTVAVAEMLKADPTVSSIVSEYAGVPAVFTVAPYPEGAVMPMIITEGNVTDTPGDTKTTIGHDITRDIRIYDDETGDSTRIEQLALAVKDLFHRRERKLQSYMPDNTFMVVKCWAEGPRLANVHTADEYVYGRIVLLVVWLTRNMETLPWFN